MPDKTPIAGVLVAGILWAAASIQITYAGTLESQHPTDASALQVQLIDGSVLAVGAGEDDRQNGPSERRRRTPLRADAAPGAQVPQALMRRRGQIFDPSTPGVVASIRG